MKKAKHRLIAHALCGALLLGMLPGAGAAEGGRTAYAPAPGLGEVSLEWSRDIYSGVTLDHTASENEHGLQKSYTITYSPGAAEVKPVLSYGPYVMGGDIMSDLVAQVEADGSKVVFAVNGDAYDTSNGVSNGLMIKNGILISTSYDNSAMAVGFRADGTAIYGHTGLNITATPEGGDPITVYHVNKERKLDAENVYLLTEQFAKTTSSTQPGVEVVLNVTTAGYQGLVIGGQITATVAGVNQVEANADKNNTPIGKGQLVLSANRGSSRYAALSALAAGQAVTVDVRSNSSDVDWSQAAQALGVFHVLMLDGVVNEVAYQENTDIHPRTVLGIKADGSVVLFQCDGRQAGWAMGVSFRNIVDYLRAQGCVTIFNFDGGGSSTITATLPGHESSTILNRPSDGSERANCNALLFVATSPPDESRSLLHVYPDIDEGYGNKVMVLENGKLGLKVGATDCNYHYQDLGDAALRYSAEGGIGTVSKDGVLTAASGIHDGKITVTAQSGAASGEIAVQVVDTITKLTADRSILSVAPGGTTRLRFTAEYNGSPVVLTSEALTFRLSDGSLGSIAADGTFTAADCQGTGELEVSYKDYTLTLPVEIGKLPVLLNDFEEDFADVGWRWRYFNGADGGLGDRGGDAKMSINYDERYVKSGDGSLRVDYDFATKPLTGTVTCETGPVGDLYLEGQPKAIGCWIYGDGNGAWVRIQLAPSAYAGDVYVDWTGWRYVENAIPANASFPYRLVWGVRVLGTPSVANGKKGTIYVDGLRAVYDFKNDDTLAPELVPGAGVTPANGAVDVSREPDISITVRDPQAEGQAYTGIDTGRTKLWINGRVMDTAAIAQEVQSDGSVKITFHPGALTMLRPGLNKIKYRVEDNAGNKFFQEWSFTVAGYAVNLEETVPPGEKAAAGGTFHYIVSATDYKNFEEFQFELGFDPKYVTLLDARYDRRLTASVSEVDGASGSVKYTLTGMSAVQKDADQPLVDLTFQVGGTAGGQTGIRVNRAVVRQTGEAAGTDLVLEGYDREVALKYTLSWSGSTVGGLTTLRLTDSDGAAVPGLGFHVTRNGEAVPFGLVTGGDGTAATDLFGSYPAGTEFLVWVEDADGALSNTQKITVYDSLGSAEPDKVTVTTGEDPASSVGISWETSLDVSEGELVIGRTADLTGDDTRTLPGEGKAIVTSMNGHVRNYRSWGVRATGLESDATYYYRVGHEGHYSAIQSFTTAPAGGDLTLAFYGDIQGAYDQFPDAIQALEALYPDIDLNLQAGDVSDDGQSYSDWANAYRGFGGYLSSRIWAPTVGNHDASNDAQAFASYFYGPDNGTYATPRNYWFQVGDILFYNLDTEAAYTYDPDFTGQIAHMEKVFGASDAGYKVVLMHRSAYPMSYDEADVRALHADFEEMGVSLVLSGHDHIYSRTEMYGGEKAPGSGIAYVVGGCSSGAKFYDADSSGRPWQDVVYDENNPVFSVLKLRDGVLTFEAYALEDGAARQVDQFTVLKRGDGQAMLEAAKAIVEQAEELGVLPQGSAPDAAAAAETLSAAVRTLPGFSVTGATVQVEAADFTAAVPGDAENYDGADGSFTYTITLSLAGESVVLEPRAGVITATAYEPVALTGSVVITGEERWGESLTAVTTGLLPVDARLTYQWTRSGEEEPVGTEGHYLLTDGDIGGALTLTVTGVAGYEGSFTVHTSEIGKALQALPRGVGRVDVAEENGTGALTGVDASMEYRAAGADAWSEITQETVEALAPGKYLVRYRETETLAAGDAMTVTILGFQAPARNDTPTAEFDAASMTLSRLSAGMAFSLDGGTTWSNAGDGQVLLPEESVSAAYGIRVYAPGVDGASSDSEEQVISLSRAAAPAGVGRVGQTADASGALTGMDSSMEYRAQGSGAWTAVTEENGTVEAAPGTYLVRVAGSGDTLASQAVIVSIAAYTAPDAAGVKLDRDSLSLCHNTSPGTAVLTATVSPEGADQSVIWTSSDENVAAVDQRGTVTAVAEGTAAITATTADGGFTAACIVTVTTYHDTYVPPYAPPTDKTDTVENQDGSKTTTVTDGKTGAVTQTTEWPDGKVKVVVTEKDGAVTETVTQAGGKKVRTVTSPEGAVEIAVTDAEGAVVAKLGLPAVVPAPEAPFADVAEGHWSREAVDFVSGMGLFNGSDDGLFHGERPMTRAMLATVLHRLSGSLEAGGDAFADIPGDAWYADAAAWAYHTGVVTGVSETAFAPDENITRETLAVMLFRFAGLLEMDTDAGSDGSVFSDSGDVSDWAEEAVTWAVESGVLQGAGQRLNPTAAATRAEVAAMLMRFIALLR